MGLTFPFPLLDEFGVKYVISELLVARSAQQFCSLLNFDSYEALLEVFFSLQGSSQLEFDVVSLHIESKVYRASSVDEAEAHEIIYLSELKESVARAGFLLYRQCLLDA